jgi:F420-0:gamma-glutamyl ligase-like protein
LLENLFQGIREESLQNLIVMNGSLLCRDLSKILFESKPKLGLIIRVTAAYWYPQGYQVGRILSSSGGIISNLRRLPHDALIELEFDFCLERL